VVTAPVNGELYNSVSCSRSDAHAQDELISGGDMFNVWILTIVVCYKREKERNIIRRTDKEEDKISGQQDPRHQAVNLISTVLRDPVQIFLALSVSWFGMEIGQ